MVTINYTELRNSLKKNLDVASDSHETVVIHRSKGKSVVMLSLEDYNGLAETAHLLSTKANVAHLAKSMRQAKEKKLISFDPTI